MALELIRLELARNPDFPDGSAEHGYEFTAPLDDEGLLDQEAWQAARKQCTVRRFWAGEPDEEGHLVHTRHRTWAFHYDGEDEGEDEPIFKFDRHRFVEGEYVSITEHDGVQCTFKVAKVGCKAVDAAPLTPAPSPGPSGLPRSGRRSRRSAPPS